MDVSQVKIGKKSIDLQRFDDPATNHGESIVMRILG